MKIKKQAAFENLFKDTNSNSQELFEDFETKLRDMLTLRRSNDAILENWLGYGYRQKLEKEQYFYCLLSAFHYYFNADENATFWKTNGLSKKRMFVKISENVLAFALACTDGDIDKCISYPLSIPKRGTVKVSNCILNLLTAVHGGDKCVEGSPYGAISQWLYLIQALELDFDKDVYGPFIREECMSDPREIIDFEQLNDFQKKVFEMMELQLKEDTLVHENRGTSYQKILERNGYFYALLDEFGELNHELKPNWCWWKQNVGQIDQAKAREEFSDITHFILSYQLAVHGGDIVEAFETLPEDPDALDTDFYRFIDPNATVESIVINILKIVSNRWWDFNMWDEILECWIQLYIELNLDFDKDVYEPYIKKNAVNQDRMHNGY